MKQCKASLSVSLSTCILLMRAMRMQDLRAVNLASLIALTHRRAFGMELKSRVWSCSDLTLGVAALGDMASPEEQDLRRRIEEPCRFDPRRLLLHLHVYSLIGYIAIYA